MTFWEEKSLKDMTTEEWESLCDGCGKCCLHKLQDIDDDSIHVTNVACRFLNHETIQCGRYSERHRFVPNCVKVTATMGDALKWMPSTCAYRLLAEGERLPDWHPLVTGDPESTVKSGNSVKGKIVDEREAGDFEDHLAPWAL